MGIDLDAPDMTGTALQRFELALPTSAYRLRLTETGAIEWLALVNGQEVIYQDEPEASSWRKFLAGFYRLLPIEDQL